MEDTISEHIKVSKLSKHEEHLIKVKALPLELRYERLRIHDFSHNHFIATEVVVMLFRDAIRQEGRNAELTRNYSGILSDRITKLAWNKLFNLAQRGFVKDLDADAEDLTMEVFTGLLAELENSNCSYVTERFGQFFDRRFIDFKRRLSTKKRQMVSNFSDVLPVNDDGEQVDPDEGMSEIADETADIFTATERLEKLDYLRRILNEDEFLVYVYYFELGIPIESKKGSITSISKKMGKTPRTIQNYKTRALKKIMETQHD